MSEIKVSQKNLESLERLYPQMCQFKNKIEHMSNEVKVEFDTMLSTVHTLFSAHWTAEQHAENERHQYFSALADTHGFDSVWSIYEVKDINENFGYLDKLYICDSEMFIIDLSVNNNVTWLELWRHADFLIKKYKTPNRIFIEGFREDPNQEGVFELLLGS